MLNTGLFTQLAIGHIFQGNILPSQLPRTCPLIVDQFFYFILHIL